MKKFGTPNGEAPGMAKWTGALGTVVVLVPLLLLPDFFLLEDLPDFELVFLDPVLLLFEPDFLPLPLGLEEWLPPLPDDPPWEEEEGCLPDPLPWPLPDGVVVGVVVGVVDVVVGVVVVEVVVVAEQDAWTFLTGPVPGGTSCEAGVPAGAVTVNVSVWPVTRVTVTLHWSADADGIAEMPSVPNAEPPAKARISSFRRMDTVVRFPPARLATKPCWDVGYATYCPSSAFATRNRRLSIALSRTQTPLRAFMAEPERSHSGLMLM